MVTLLPERPKKPSFAEQLGSVLGSEMGGLAENFAAKMAERKSQKDENRALKEMLGVDFEGLSAPFKERLASELFKRYEPGRGQESENPAQGVFNEMSRMVAQNLPGIGISLTGGIGPEASENRAMFNSMRSRLEGALLPLVNKGALSKERFNFILDQIPKASDRQRTIVGKLRGLSQALGESGMPIDTDILDTISWSTGHKKKVPSKLAKEEESPIGDEIPMEVEEGPSKLRSALSALPKGTIRELESVSDLLNIPMDYLTKLISPEFSERKEKFKQQRMQALEEVLPTQEGHLEDILGMAGEFLPSVLAGPGGLGAKGVQLGAAALGKKGLKELDAPEIVQDIGGAIASGVPGLVKGTFAKTLKPGTAQKETYELLKSVGVKEKDIVPFIQNPKKVRFLGKLAGKSFPKGELKGQLGEISQPLYAAIKEKGSKIPPLKGRAAIDFAHDFERHFKEIPSFRQDEIRKEVNKLLKGPIDYKSLRDFQEYLNFKVKGTQGGKAVLNLLKGPIDRGIEKLSPQVAKDLRVANEIYSKGMDFVDKLSPSTLEELAGKAFGLGGLGTAAWGLITLNPAILGAAGLSLGSSRAAKAILTNPRLQHLRSKMVDALKKGNKGVLLKLVSTAEKEISKETPREEK